MGSSGGSTVFGGSSSVGPGGFTLAIDKSQLDVIPEPGTAVLVGLGLSGLAAFRRQSQLNRD